MGEILRSRYEQFVAGKLLTRVNINLPSISRSSFKAPGTVPHAGNVQPDAFREGRERHWDIIGVDFPMLSACVEPALEQSTLSWVIAREI